MFHRVATVQWYDIIKSVRKQYGVANVATATVAWHSSPTISPLEFRNLLVDIRGAAQLRRLVRRSEDRELMPMDVVNVINLHVLSLTISCDCASRSDKNISPACILKSGERFPRDVTSRLWRASETCIIMWRRRLRERIEGSCRACRARRFHQSVSWRWRDPAERSSPITLAGRELARDWRCRARLDERTTRGQAGE